MTDLLIRGGRILDPSQGLDMIGNVLIREGRIAALGPGLEAEAPETAGDREGGAAPPAWRAVVVGNARFATNGFLNMLGNGDLLTSSINWLAEDEDLIAISPKEASSSPLLLTAGQQRLVFWMPVVLVPGLITVFGVTVWRRRRRL